MVASEVAAERSLGDLAVIAVASGVGELLQLVNDGLESTHKQALGLLDGLGSRSGGADLVVLRFQLPEPAFENVNGGEDLRVGIALATGLACATGAYTTPSTPTYGRDRGRTHQGNKLEPNQPARGWGRSPSDSGVVPLTPGQPISYRVALNQPAYLTQRRM